ncbi:DoxX family protein [Salicibibacter kimchii]|uniref:DoxX family protein n=1 Tax=Salicibibacter kimchii TaxID=2099786 RepID=A0A345C1M5_9BACI|nr:DoxX family protein [Salicibibacter kimchii]AXF57106.1 DoxX family protein [Salicibibacter kimchii]
MVIQKIMQNTMEWGLVVLRLLFGIVIVAIGLEKLIDVTGFRETLGITGIPSQLAYLVASFEVLGGLLLIAGFIIRIAALTIAGIKALSFFWAPYMDSVIISGFEILLILLTLAVIIAMNKKHKFSVTLQ